MMIFKIAEYGTRLLFRVANKTEDLFLILVFVRKGKEKLPTRQVDIKKNYQSFPVRAELASHFDINRF